MIGWAPLIEAAEVVVGIYAPPDTKITQIKEKFGYMRIYTDRSTPELNAALIALEEASTRICIHCGRPSKIREIKGWYTNRCC